MKLFLILFSFLISFHAFIKDASGDGYEMNLGLDIPLTLFANPPGPISSAASLTIGKKFNSLLIFTGYRRASYYSKNSVKNNSILEINADEFLLGFKYNLKEYGGGQVLRLVSSYGFGSGKGKFEDFINGSATNNDVNLNYGVINIGAEVVFPTSNNFFYSLGAYTWALLYSDSDVPGYAKSSNFHLTVPSLVGSIGLRF